MSICIPVIIDEAVLPDDYVADLVADLSVRQGLMICDLAVSVLENETDIVITEDVFNEDALIFSGVKSEFITLRSDDHNRTVKFTLGGAPWLGIWAKPGAPYVCIEPWCGVNDSQIKKADFSEKDGINAIGKGEKWNFTWTAEFSE